MQIVQKKGQEGEFEPRECIALLCQNDAAWPAAENHKNHRPRVLFLVSHARGLRAILKEIKQSGLEVALAFTADRGVAACLSHRVTAVVVDAAFLRDQDWSVVKSLKLVKPNVPVLRLDRVDLEKEGCSPAEVDASASCENPREVLRKLKELLAEDQSGQDLQPAA